jgi:hypothetical protein
MTCLGVEWKADSKVANIWWQQIGRTRDNKDSAKVKVMGAGRVSEWGVDYLILPFCCRFRRCFVKDKRHPATLLELCKLFDYPLLSLSLNHIKCNDAIIFAPTLGHPTRRKKGWIKWYKPTRSDSQGTGTHLLSD